VRTLKKIFGPEREEVAGDWRRLQNEELRNLYASPNFTRANNLRNMRWMGHVARMIEVRDGCKILS